MWKLDILLVTVLSLSCFTGASLLSQTNIEKLSGQIFCTNLLEKFLRKTIFHKLITASSISLDDRINRCVENQEKIKKMNEEGQKYGYSVENNKDVFFSPEEQKERLGLKNHVSTKKRYSRSLNETTYIPPIFDDSERNTKFKRELLRNER